MKKLLLVLSLSIAVLAFGFGLWRLTVPTLVDETRDLEPPVLYLAIMTHIEGWENEVEKEESFDVHKTAVREMATLFEEYDARVTFEAKPEFVEASVVWGDNVLKELYLAGHGIGVHADLGGQVGRTTTDRMAKLIRAMRLEMEKLLDAPVRHVSGICSDVDWVSAAIDAGYKFTSGGVGFCAMSMPKDLRPDEYKDCDNASECHGNMPVELEDRMTPWQTSSGSEWTRHDPDGELVIIASSDGVRYLAEADYGEEDDFNEEDVEAYVELLEEALTYVQPGRVNVLYLSLSIGKQNWGENIFRQILESTRPYIERGQVEWKTLPDIYDLYTESAG